jgi:L-erythro-3,5-diaminohexanoate dehydrogenase
MVAVDSSPYGLHRVVSPKGVLPQQADVLDPSLPVRAGEVLIDVERLNLDAASYRQLVEETGGHPDELKARVVSIVRAHGKMHNPVTGSGGMLIGTVSGVGEGRTDVRRGDRVATLVSLTLTPLVLTSISDWDGESEQVPAEGYAIVFETGICAKLPPDLPDRLSLAVLDVAGAPAQTARLADGRRRTLVVGAAGKSGLLCMFSARGRSEEVVGLVHHEEDVELLRSLGFDAFLADASDPVGCLDAAARALGGDGERGVADLVINCVNVPGTEGASILLTEEGGTLYLFSMATSFTAAALTAEGLGKDLTMIIGSGYAPGHAEVALGMVRDLPELRAVFEQRYLR